MLALMSTAIGAQDLAALIALQPAIAEHAHSHNIASPFGTIEPANFTMPEPVDDRDAGFAELRARRH